MIKLSVVLATQNEEENIGACLDSVKSIADEIVVVDENSTDKTSDIAESFGAKVYKEPHHPLFHITKQIALEKATGEWILQLDADERVTEELLKEIMEVINMTKEDLQKYQDQLTNRKLFLRHQKIIEKRDGEIGNENGEIVAFFIPRLNYFLGKYLKHGGVYPDGIIRLVKNGKAKFPCKSVHEQIEVEGKVGWLNNDLIHMADPTFIRYLQRNSRYIDLFAGEMQKKRTGKSPLQIINYFFIMPLYWFFLTQIRHKGIFDGWQGVVFSFFSALRFPRAYWRYLRKR